MLKQIEIKIKYSVLNKFSASRKGIQLQPSNQEFFGAGEVSWNKGISINVSCMTHKRKGP